MDHVKDVADVLFLSKALELFELLFHLKIVLALLLPFFEGKIELYLGDEGWLLLLIG